MSVIAASQVQSAWTATHAGRLRNARDLTPQGLTVGRHRNLDVPRVSRSQTDLIPGHGTTTVVSGLTNGLTYTFTVTAENGLVEGPPSVMSGPVTVGAPAASTALRVTRISNSALKIAFTVPKNNGAAITQYSATCTSTNGGATKTKTGKAGPLTVTGLSAGKTYTCTVKATNSRGSGPASHTSPTIKA